MIIPAGVIRCNTMNLFNYKTVNINRKIVPVKMFQKSLAVINSSRKIPKLNIITKYWENKCLNKMISLISIGLKMLKQIGRASCRERV